MQRDKTYKKCKFYIKIVYERTFDTENSSKEANEMALILKNTPCSKLILITGIGKWTSAITPNLIKEIKQVGGPDISSLTVKKKKYL